MDFTKNHYFGRKIQSRMFKKIKKSYFLLLVVSLVLTEIVGFTTACTGNAQSKEGAKTEQNASQGNGQTDGQNAPNASTDSRVPAKAYKILEYIRQNNAPMDNYVGGRNFSNRERRLPQKDVNGSRMKYQEWDVNPKKRGKNRGTERIITAANGQAWYTDDHYATFTEMK
jgi:ribonuclease T1